MSPRLDTWIWTLIYGGMIIFGLGMALRNYGAAWGEAVAVAGVVVAAIGAVLVWVRSRSGDPG